jgi:hypothetical protein
MLIIINHCPELLHQRVISSAVGRKQEARGRHSQVEMTGAALVGRRWADRLCRDRTVTVLSSRSLPSPVQPINRPHTVRYCCCVKQLRFGRTRITGRRPGFHTSFSHTPGGASALSSSSRRFAHWGERVLPPFGIFMLYACFFCPSHPIRHLSTACESITHSLNFTFSDGQTSWPLWPLRHSSIYDYYVN